MKKYRNTSPIQQKKIIHEEKVKEIHVKMLISQEKC